MKDRSISRLFVRILGIVLLAILLFPTQSLASFIESTMGAAVVKDAVATYYNPAALVQLKHPQLIALNSYSAFHGEFTGQSVSSNGASQSGNSTSNNDNQLPAFYFAGPLSSRITGGLALIANDLSHDIESGSMLRYVQSDSHIQDIDLVSALSIKLNEYTAIGLGLSLSRAHFLMQPIYGFPSLNIPDSTNKNESDGTSWAGTVGIFIKPNENTSIGLAYRSAMTYNMSGTSTFTGTPSLTSNNYHFTYWTPARSMLSVNHSITKKIGVIATVQYIQWNIFDTITMHNLAVETASQPIILPTIKVPYHFHNSWLLTLGTHLRLTEKCVLRLAGSYVQSPSGGNYQIDNGDTLVLGGSVGYQLFKNILIDGSYAHVFVQDKDIHIISSAKTINGVNQNAGNVFSLKITWDV